MIDLIIQRRKLAFSIGLLITFLCALGLFRFQLNNDYRAFLGQEDQALASTDWLNARLGNGRDNLILIYKPATGQIFDPISFLQYSEVSTEAKTLPVVSSSISLFDQEKRVEFRKPGGGTVVGVVPFMSGTNIFDNEGRAIVSNEALNLPHISRRYIAKDLSSAAVLLTLDFDLNPGERSAQISSLVQAVQKIEDQLQSVQTGDRLFLTGAVLFENSATNIIRKDLRRIIPLCALFFILILWWVYRSLKFALICILLVLFPVLGSVGAAAFMGKSFSNLSLAGIMLVGTLAVADILHISNSYFLKKMQSHTFYESIAFALRNNFKPVVATTITTIIGQIALLISPAEPIRSMATIVIVGSILALVLAVLMLPIVLISVRPKSSKNLIRISEVLGRVSYICSERYLLTIFSGITITVISCAGVVQTQMVDSLEGWFSDETKFNQGLTELNNKYMGSNTLTLAIEAPPTDIVAARQYPEETKALTTYRALQESLGSAVDGYWYSIPELATATKEILDEGSLTTLYRDVSTDYKVNRSKTARLTAETLARAGLMTNYSTGQADYTLWHLDIFDSSSFAVVAGEKKMTSIAKKNVGDRDIRVSGIGLAIAHLSAQNYNAILLGSSIAFLSISFVLLFIFKSIRIGLISFIPNSLPLIMTFGLWGVLKGDMNLAAITVYSVVLGIIVDDTIHIIMKYQRELERTPRNPRLAVSRAVKNTSAGILCTTLIISAGFALLGLSDFLLSAQRSQMAAIAVMLAFIFDVTVLPAILVRFGARKA